MNIMELGAIGELVGGVAVIASVVYVGLQVRQSAHQASQGNAIERARAGREVSALLNDVFLQASGDPSFAVVVRQGLADFASLPDEDKLRLEMRFLTPSAMYVTSVYFAAEDGLVDKEFADSAFDYLVSLLKSPGAETWWDTVRTYFHPGVVREVDRRRGEPGGPPALSEIPWWSAPMGARGV